MPLEIDSRPGRSLIRVAAAPVVELVFSFYLAEKFGLNIGGSKRPWFDALHREHPGLLERLSTFWASGSYYEWAELILLAQRSGTLFSEPEEFLGRLEQTAAKPYHVPALPSEPEGVRQILQDRLDRLAGSAEFRASYIALVREFWDVLKPFWLGGPTAQANELVESYQQRLKRVTDVREVLPRYHFARQAAHAATVSRAVEAGEAVIVPLTLSGVGIGFLAFPGLLLIGVGPDVEKRQDKRRDAAEKAAARFKLLSDPTRLSILISLCSAPFSISDLADFFELAQPTVSVHVKSLREAGLLESTKVRGQTLYRSSQDKVRELVDGALSEMFTT